MGSILKDILEAEKKAREFTEEAEKYKSETIAAVEEQKNKIINDSLAKARAEVERIKTGHARSIEEALKSVEDSSKKDIERLAALEAERSEQWIEDIYAAAMSDAP